MFRITPVLLLIAVGLLPRPAHATAADALLKGRVVDAATAAPLANVRIDVGSHRTGSGADGRFEIRVAPGDHRLVVVVAGYLDFEETVTLAADEVREIEILLAPRRAYEERVDVVAARPPVERPATMPIETRDVLTAAGTGDNIFHVLQTMPGVAATEEFGSRLSVRGGSPDENLTIMDGVEIHNPYRLFGLTSAFNPETVRRFELTAGGFGAQYGDRLSSLLLVENRDGDSSRRFKGSAAVSLTDVNVVMEGRWPARMNGSWIATARRTYYDLVADRITGTNLPSFGDLQAKGVWNVRGDDRLSVFALASREDTDASFTGSAPGENGAFVTKTRNDVVSARYEAHVGPRGTSTTTVAWYRNTDRLGFEGSLRPETQRSNSPDTNASPLSGIAIAREVTVKDVSAREDLGFLVSENHVVHAGVEVHRLDTGLDWVASFDRDLGQGNGSSVQGGAGLPPLLVSSRPSTRTGAWFQDRVSLGRAVSVEPGLRVDYSSFNRRGSVSPRVAASFRLAPSLRVRASGGLYYQSPGWEKLLQSDYLVDITPAANVQLASERSVHAVVSLEKDLGRAALVRVEGYYKTFGDLIVGRLETDAERAARISRYDFPADLQWSIPRAPLITSEPSNDSTGDAYGFDLFVSRSAPSGRKGLTGWASYTFGVANRTAYGRTYPFEYDRRHAVSVVGDYRIGPRLDVAVTARVASGFPRTPVLGLRVASVEDARGRLVPARDQFGLLVYTVDSDGVGNLNTARLPVFARVDVRVTWRPRGASGRWEFYADVINALNRKNAGEIHPQLMYDPSSSKPAIVETRSSALPILPSLGLRVRFEP